MSNNALLGMAFIAMLMIVPAATRLHAQASATLSAGVGYRALQPAVAVQLPESSFAVIPQTSIAPYGLFSIGGRLALYPQLSAEVRVGGAVGRVAAVERRDVVLGINGIPVPGLIRREVAFDHRLFTAEVVGLLDIGRLYLAEIGLGVAVPSMGRVAVQDIIESPPGVTFVSTGTDRQNLGNGQFAGGVSAMLQVTMGLRRQVSIGPTSWLEPFVRVGIASRLQPGTPSVLPIDVALGVTLTLDGNNQRTRAAAQVQQTLPITRYRVVADTTTEEVMAHRDRPDTAWLRSVVVDTVVIIEDGTSTAVITTRSRIRRIIRRVDPPADIVLSTNVEGLPMRTAAKLVIRFQLISTELAPCHYAVMVNGDTVERRTMVAFDDVATYRLGELLDRVAEADVYTVHIVAWGQTLRGAHINSVSETLEIVRSRDRRTLRIGK